MAQHTRFKTLPDQYCYLPLYIFCGEHLLCSKLRTSNIDAAAGAREEVERIVAQIRARWPSVRIILRADSGFCRQELMSWCEQNAVDYVFGLAKNSRLVRAIGAELRKARAESALDLFADRLSSQTFRANQLRLWFSSAAYVLMHALRRIGLAATVLASACSNTIRLKLLKIGAVVTISVRRVKLAMSSACPHRRQFISAFHALTAAAR